MSARSRRPDLHRRARAVPAAVVLTGMLSLMTAPPVLAQQTAHRPVLTATASETRRSAATDTIALRVDVRMSPGWHVGAFDPGKVGVPTRLAWDLPAGWTLGEERWPVPTREIVGRDTSFTLAGPFSVDVVLVKPPASHTRTIRGTLSYGICREVCIVGYRAVTFTLR